MSEKPRPSQDPWHMAHFWFNYRTFRALMTRNRERRKHRAYIAKGVP